MDNFKNNNNMFGDIDAARFAMGEHARHIPLNMIFQNLGDKSQNNKHAGVFQFQYNTDLVQKYQTKYTHIAILGDAFIRPRLVIGTDMFIGNGISHIYMNGFSELIQEAKNTEILFKL